VGGERSSSPVFRKRRAEGPAQGHAVYERITTTQNVEIQIRDLTQTRKGKLRHGPKIRLGKTGKEKKSPGQKMKGGKSMCIKDRGKRLSSEKGAETGKRPRQIQHSGGRKGLRI